MATINFYEEEESICQNHKAFTNYISALSELHHNKVMVRYYSNGEYKTLTYAEVDRMSTNLACKWAPHTQGLSVVSFLSDHSISYMVVMLALLKLRVTMLAVSPRNSEAAIVNLLEKTGSRLLIANVKYETISKAAAANIDGVKIVIIQSFDIEEHRQLPLNADFKRILDFNFTDQDLLKSALIIHSSGSTSFPKPIHLSNRYLIRMARSLCTVSSSCEGANTFDENDTLLSCVPLFHIFGFAACFTMSTVGGSVVILERLPPSPQEIVRSIEINKVTVICAPPLILENLIPHLKERNDYSFAKDIKFVLVAGAPFKQESGDWLLSHGINVRNGYASTEVGLFLCTDLNPNSKNWNTLRPCIKDPNGDDYAVFETYDESEPDIKHLYIRGDCPTLAIHVSNRSDGGYDTNDLFREHPDYPGYYIYLGRRDDTLVMENGEKTNPVPMESTIRQSNVVKQVVVLGQRRQCTAALIEIELEYAIRLNPSQIIEAVNDAVEKANVSCPSHSIILSQMIWILPFNRTLPSTDKGTVIRKKAAAQYAEEVEKLYKDFIEGPSRDTSITADTSTWSKEKIDDFLVECASDVLRVPKSKFEDHSESIFDLGFNSLSAIQLRNHIGRYFDDVSQNFLYEHATIDSMREALTSSIKEDISEQVERRYQQTQNLAHSYLKKARVDFPVAHNCYDKKKDTVVLLTGATGSLGSFMLRDLLKDARVKKVYCCVRGDKEKLFKRLVEAFESRSLDISLLDTDRVKVLPMAFNKPFLGFSQELYNELKQEVTVIQHCAWLLDFNMPIDHFDKECIAPFYNLLKFAYHETNPMHVHFISSVAASASLGTEVAEEPLPFDSHITMPLGYAQSKFVVEILFEFLTSKVNFPCYIERLGQVCGDSEKGVWNISELYPLMFIGGGSIMHKMPDLDIVIDWIPVDAASATIVDIMLRTAYLPANRHQSIYHIVNPRIETWSDVLEAMRNSGMRFDTVSPAEWVESLSKDSTNPAYRLMSFYEINFRELKMPIWKTVKTSALTPLINQTPVLDTNLFSKFLAHWKAVGFYVETK